MTLHSGPRPRTLIAGLLIPLLAVGSALAQSPAPKPKIPAGRDPGGTPVALIGGGVDYTRAGIAMRLARDGEGEIIGWDFVDRDNRPFDHCVATAPDPGLCPTALAEALLTNSPSARLVVARADGARPQSFVDAVRMVARTPARIILVAIEPQFEVTLLREAARLNASTLFIALGAAPDPPAANSPDWPDNIVVAGSTQEGAVLTARAAELKSNFPALEPAGIRAKLAAEQPQR